MERITGFPLVRCWMDSVYPKQLRVPLIMVTQFVGFLGGWNHPGKLPPLLAATVAALVTRWTTFTPCFLWIFLGGPYIERLRGN